MTTPKAHQNGRAWIMRIGAGLAVLGIGTAVAVVVRHMSAAGHPLMVERTNSLKVTVDSIDTKVDAIGLQQGINTAILERIEERLP